jgi:hypothetical protein
MKQTLVKIVASVALPIMTFVSGCGEQASYKPQYKIEQTPSQPKIEQDPCASVTCDDVNCYNTIDRGFCATRKEVINNYNKFYKRLLKNDPYYFINMDSKSIDSLFLPEIKENFKIFKNYAIAKTGGSIFENGDCFYKGEKICSIKDMIDILKNSCSELYVNGETQNIENWESNIPEVQEHIEKLQSDWIKRNRIKNEIAQIRSQQNRPPAGQENILQPIAQQPVAQQQPDQTLDIFKILFKGLGSDIVFYEYTKKN